MIQAEAPESCVIAEGIEVTASSTLDSSTHTFVEDKLEEILPDGVTTEVEFHEVVLSIADGAPDLDFVDTAHVAMRAPDSRVLPTIQLVEFSRDPAAPVGRELWLDSGVVVDISPYVEEGGIEFEIELFGAIPQDTWLLDAEVCFGVTAEYEVQLY